MEVLSLTSVDLSVRQRTLQLHGLSQRHVKNQRVHLCSFAAERTPGHAAQWEQKFDALDHNPIRLLPCHYLAAGAGKHTEYSRYGTYCVPVILFMC